jgi:hypothetical protein
MMYCCYPRCRITLDDVLLLPQVQDSILRYRLEEEGGTVKELIKEWVTTVIDVGKKSEGEGGI